MFELPINFVCYLIDTKWYFRYNNEALIFNKMFFSA